MTGEYEVEKFVILVFEFRLKNFRYKNKKNKKVNKICEEYNILFVRRLKK